MAAWLPGILVAIVGIVPGFLAWQAAGAARRDAATLGQRTALIEDRKVDREAYEVAQRLYSDAVAEAGRQIAQLRQDLDLEHRQVQRLRARQAMLERLLIGAGIDVPAEQDQLP